MLQSKGSNCPLQLRKPQATHSRKKRAKDSQGGNAIPQKFTVLFLACH